MKKRAGGSCAFEIHQLMNFACHWNSCRMTRKHSERKKNLIKCNKRLHSENIPNIYSFINLFLGRVFPNFFHFPPVASIPIPGGCSLCAVKNRGSFDKIVDQNFFPIFQSAPLTTSPPVFYFPLFLNLYP